MILVSSRIVSRGRELDQAGLLPQGAQMLREYHGMMDGNRGRSLALMPLISNIKQRLWEGWECCKVLATFLVLIKTVARGEMAEARSEWQEPDKMTRVWPCRVWADAGPSEPLSITMINPSTSAEPVRRKIAFCQSRSNLRWTGQPHASWRHFNQNGNFVVAIPFIFAVELQHWLTTNVSAQYLNHLLKEAH